MRVSIMLAALTMALSALPVRGQAQSAALNARDTAGPVSSAAANQAQLKSRSRAQALALGHTVVATATGAALMSQGVESQWKGDAGYWLLVYGTLIAPSAGNFYARDTRRTAVGLQVRGAGATLVLGSVISQLLTSPEFDMDNPEGGDLHWDAVNVMGTGLIIGGAAYSILTAPRSVSEHNERVTSAHGVRIAPAVARGGAVGVQVGIDF
ncbi:MAG TPA: hypothetical protein VGB24_01415 [Longimicrobium sp.]|jgi:hypothetical protein|uniref:hypothetical protein n=1 Tax=Longimicrobium sp. TaxID=2029185 RepID=UPI002ED9B379